MPARLMQSRDRQYIYGLLNLHDILYSDIIGKAAKHL